MLGFQSQSSQQKQDIGSDNANQFRLNQNSTECPANHRLITYIEEARYLDEAIKLFDEKIKQIDRETILDELLAEKKTDEIKTLEKKSKAAAIVFKKEVENYRKSQSKLRCELEEQELKKAKFAKKLSQVHTDEIELEQVQNNDDIKTEAGRFVKELVSEGKMECRLDEQTHELFSVRKEIENNVHELNRRQIIGINEFKNKQKEIIEMTTSIL